MIGRRLPITQVFELIGNRSLFEVVETNRTLKTYRLAVIRCQVDMFSLPKLFNKRITLQPFFRRQMVSESLKPVSPPDLLETGDVIVCNWFAGKFRDVFSQILSL